LGTRTNSGELEDVPNFEHVPNFASRPPSEGIVRRAGFCYIESMADIKGDESRIFQVPCPCCGAALWVDGTLREVIRSEKLKKVKGSLDDLVAKEIKREEEMGSKFEATFELHKQRHSAVEEKFLKALADADKEEEKPGEEE
jgi:hypothetical protein